MAQTYFPRPQGNKQTTQNMAPHRSLAFLKDFCVHRREQDAVRARFAAQKRTLRAAQKSLRAALRDRIPPDAAWRLPGPQQQFAVRATCFTTVVASDEPVRLSQGRACSPPPLSTVLDPAGSPFKYLSDKGKAYLGRRARWGVKIYGRNDRSFLGTLPRSYGHMQSWKHTIDEGAGRWRDLTATEAFRIQSFDPRGFDLSGLSRRQQMYLAGNAIDQCVLKALFKSLL